MKQLNYKSDKMLEVEDKFGVELEELLLTLFVDKNMSTYTIAKELGITYVTARKWIKATGIYSRRLKL